MAERPGRSYVRAGERAAAEAPAAPERVEATASRFALLYESRDRRLCLFEDAEGHLTSVDAERFA